MNMRNCLAVLSDLLVLLCSALSQCLRSWWFELFSGAASPSSLLSLPIETRVSTLTPFPINFSALNLFPNQILAALLIPEAASFFSKTRVFISCGFISFPSVGRPNGEGSLGLVIEEVGEEAGWAVGME
ncbi:hypothetical protein Droror1_Dr00014464 [Drosera rotundifolia]